MTNALHWSARLIAFAALLQSIEWIQLRAAMSERGVWRWSILRGELRGFGVFLAYPNVLFLLGARMLCAAGLLVWPGSPALPFLMGVLALSSLLMSMRWRGTFNGGSDYMTNAVTLSLWVASFFPEQPLAAKLCLGLIAGQACLSYFVSGAAKAANPDWRRGSALAGFLRLPGYGTPPWLAEAFAERDGLARLTARGLIAFELSFPLALLNPRICALYLALALLFHLANVYVFGLNRFLWAWLAAYPAIYFWS